MATARISRRSRNRSSAETRAETEPPFWGQKRARRATLLAPERAGSVAGGHRRRDEAHLLRDQHAVEVDLLADDLAVDDLEGGEVGATDRGTGRGHFRAVRQH